MDVAVECISTNTSGEYLKHTQACACRHHWPSSSPRNAPTFCSFERREACVVEQVGELAGAGFDFLDIFLEFGIALENEDLVFRAALLRERVYRVIRELILTGHRGRIRWSAPARAVIVLLSQM